MNDLRADLQEFLVRRADQLLHAAHRFDVQQMLHFGPAAAYLWAGLGCRTPLAQNPQLRRLAIRIGDHLVSDIRRDLAPQANPPHLAPHNLADMLAALGPSLSPACRAKWQRILRQSAEQIQTYLQAKWHQLGKPGPYTGTGPNHLFRHAAALFRIGRLLSRPAWAALASAAMRRLIRLQDPHTGCFPEYHGPVVAYHWVTLDGLARFLTSGGGKFALPPLQRGIEYGLQHLYPDLVRLELFDERNRLWRQETAHFHPEVCLYHPQGQRLTALVLQHQPSLQALAARRRRDNYIGIELTQIARALTVPFDATQQPLPVESPTLTLRTNHHGLLRRRHGWFYALSTLSSAAPPHHPFHMDRTTNFVLFHDRVGRIVAGGGDKHTLDSATFRIIESGECGYFPALAGRIHQNRQADRLELDYGAANATLTVSPTNARLCRLTAAVDTNMHWRQTDLNLQLWLPFHKTVHLGPRRTACRLDPARATRPWPTRGIVELPGAWRIQTVPDALLIWPYLPYNCYGGPPHRMTPDQAVGILRVPLDPTRRAAAVQFRIL